MNDATLLAEKGVDDDSGNWEPWQIGLLVTGIILTVILFGICLMVAACQRWRFRRQNNDFE